MKALADSDAAMVPVAGLWRASLRARGIALVPRLFDGDLVARLATAVDRARANEERRLGLDFLRSIAREGYVSDLLAIGEPIVELLAHDALHAVLLDVFEEEPRLRVGQAICLDPGQGRGTWPRCWHADMHRQAVDVGDPGFIYGVNCLVHLDDVSEANGATVALGGSHRTPELLPAEDADLEARAFRAVAPAGSALLIEGGTWHAAGRNGTDAPRRALKLLFTRRWIRPEIDYLALGCDQHAGKSPRTREEASR